MAIRLPLLTVQTIVWKDHPFLLSTVVGRMHSSELIVPRPFVTRTCFLKPAWCIYHSDSHSNMQRPTMLQASLLYSGITSCNPKEANSRLWVSLWHALQWPEVFITFLRENLWRKIHALWVWVHRCLNCSCNYGRQTCSWVKQDFI